MYQIPCLNSFHFNKYLNFRQYSALKTLEKYPKAIKIFFEYDRKNPLSRYILGVLTHTTAWTDSEEVLSNGTGTAVYSQPKKIHPQPAKLDLNKKSFPKQKTIQNFTIDAQGIIKTRNENPPTWEIEVTC